MLYYRHFDVRWLLDMSTQTQRRRRRRRIRRQKEVEDNHTSEPVSNVEYSHSLLQALLGPTVFKFNREVEELDKEDEKENSSEQVASSVFDNAKGLIVQ